MTILSKWRGLRGFVHRHGPGLLLDHAGQAHALRLPVRRGRRAQPPGLRALQFGLHWNLGVTPPHQRYVDGLPSSRSDKSSFLEDPAPRDLDELDAQLSKLEEKTKSASRRDRTPRGVVEETVHPIEWTLQTELFRSGTRHSWCQSRRGCRRTWLGHTSQFPPELHFRKRSNAP